MYTEILIEMKKYYRDIIKSISDDKVFLLEKDNKRLYISKSFGELRFITYCDDVAYNIIDDVFEYKEVLLSIGALNKYIDNMDKKKNFFNMVMDFLKEV